MPRDAHKELQKILPSLDENENQTLLQPPAAGLVTQHQDVYFIPPPRVVGGARGNSAPVSTYGNAGANSQTGPISCGAVARGSRLHDVTIHQTTSIQYDAPHQDWHVGPAGFPPTMGRGDASPRRYINIVILRTLCS